MFLGVFDTKLHMPTAYSKPLYSVLYKIYLIFTVKPTTTCTADYPYMHEAWDCSIPDGTAVNCLVRWNIADGWSNWTSINGIPQSSSEAAHYQNVDGSLDFVRAEISHICIKFKLKKCSPMRVHNSRESTNTLYIYIIIWKWIILIHIKCI